MMKLKIVVLDATFEAEGEFALNDDLLSLVGLWLLHISGGDVARTQAQIDALTSRIRSQSDALAAVVTSNPSEGEN